MKVKILVTAKYADFSRPGHIKARKLEAGAEADFPDEYARYLIGQELAAELTYDAKAGKMTTVTPVEEVENKQALQSARADEAQPDEPGEVEEPRPAPRGRKGR